VRHWRPSAKVKAHRPERSFLCVAAQRNFSWVAVIRPTERFVDIEVSLELSFGILGDEKERAGKDAGAQNRNAPAGAGAHYFTGVM
jgi:hypothetical protein